MSHTRRVLPVRIRCRSDAEHSANFCQSVLVGYAAPARVGASDPASTALLWAEATTLVRLEPCHQSPPPERSWRARSTTQHRASAAASTVLPVGQRSLTRHNWVLPVWIRLQSDAERGANLCQSVLCGHALWANSGASSIVVLARRECLTGQLRPPRVDSSSVRRRAWRVPLRARPLRASFPDPTQGFRRRVHRSR